MTDWDDFRFFVAVARHGSVSGAARVLKVAQPTVGRRIAAFEKRLGAQLFVRSVAGWKLSEVGRSMLVHGERMEEQAHSAELLATGRDLGIDGKVRITASEWLTRSVLGPAVGPFLAQHTGLSLELVADARHLNLVRREADIALRPSRFTHEDVSQREVAVMEFGLYASDTYLTRRGMPDFARGCEGHEIVAMTDDMGHIPDGEWLALLADRARIVIRTNGREPMATMAAAGVGLTCLPRFLGDATPGLRLLPTPGPAPHRQLWVGVHRAARSTPRIRATLTFLTDCFARLRPALRPTMSRT